MSTVSKEIADDIVRGMYKSDKPRRIVKYQNAWGGESYGVTFCDQDPNRYLRETEFVRSPVVYWEHQA